MNLNGFAKRTFAAWMVIFFMSTPLLGARVAHAQNSTVADAPRVLEWIKTALTDFITNTMQAAIVTATINGLSFAADRLAYDAAVKIATGGNAEEPLFDGTKNETYLGMLATGMAGEAIGSLSETITGAGGILSNFNLCAPSSPYILLQFKLGIKGVYDRPEPKCDFNKMFGPEGSWTSFVADLSDYEDPVKNQMILTELANMYDPAKSEFSVGLQLSSDIFGKSTTLPLLGVQKKLEDGGFKDVVDFITGEVETPADMLRTQVKDAQKESGDTRKQATLAMLANGEVLLQLGVHAGSVFTNTLISKLQERVWQGMFDFNTVLTDPFDPDSFALNTTKNAAEHYRSLLTAAPLQISNYSILSEFITCPGADARGLYNCVADSSFVSAVAREEAGVPLTIAEAIEEGLIDGAWPLIPASDVARNQDAFCYTYGFCYGNLVKLRKARVISIGWELAASSPANPANAPVTLQEVVDGFNSCGSDDLPDDNHPWCKMIDPDWVLKYPDTQCRMQTNGELLLTDKADERAQTCVDMPSCIGEDADGNCTGGYGYCVAEENTWRFRGESCPEYAASCVTFEDSEGVSSSLLKNTLNPGPCTEDTVGCQWYATEKTEQGDGVYEYAAVTSIASADTNSATYASRVYFNNKVETCSAEEGGCSTLIERDADLRLNAIDNASFERDEDTDDRPDGWYDYHLGGVSWPSEVAIDTGYARDGDVAVSPGQASSGRGALYQPGIELGQARTYALSFYARQLAEGGADTVSAVLDLRDEDGGTVDISGLAITGDCDDSYTNILGSVVSTGIGIEAVVPGDDAEYDRFTCIFTVPPLADTSLRVFGDLYFYNFDGYIDNVQLEQGEDASVSIAGYSDTSYTMKVVKVAPAYLGCTGGEDDPAECGNYAQVCAEQDLGCSLYTPANGDPAISGIATELDACPAECAGYDTYRQEATLYEPDGVDSVYFIPDTATVCAAEDVGCDEFTNLDTEEQEYYSFMRACVTETQALANVASDNEATYYTWEGSDEDGYQLKRWSLLESNAGSSDYRQVGADGVLDTAPDLAPCSNWTTNDNGIACADTIDVNGDGYYDWDSEECNARADIFTNANCREFYDASGNIHYRDWENTVTVNNACQSYRKTTLAGSDTDQRSATCSDAGGYYVVDSGECRFYGYPEESTSCDESANGCRAYAGGRSRNSRLVLEELFEDGTLNQWDSASAANATYSNESLAAEGHSMLLTGPVTSFVVNNGSECTDSSGCAGAAISFGGDCTVSEGKQYCGTLADELYAGKTYTVSVVAKGAGTLQLGFDYNATPAAPAIDLAFGSAVDLDDGWQVITLGPLIMDADEYPAFGEGTSLVLVPTGTAYVDNIVLREGEENLTIIRDSWVTPASCDESITGDYSAQYYLGCQEYTDQDGEKAYLKSLSSLCDEDKVGCDAFFKTQESESTTAQTFNATCSNVDADADGEPDVATSATACHYFYKTVSTYDTESPYLCTIATGETSCLFSRDGFTPLWKLGSMVAVSYGAETVITPADQAMFLVVTNDVECYSGAAGCTELGDPKWSQDRNSTEGAESVYLMNLPDTYSDTLCAHEELFCDAFTATDASTYYVKSPLKQLCEYRTDVSIDGTVYSGWFREGTDSFCYGTCEDSATGTEGNACGSSADCASSETCNAKNPSYVIGGSKSGIWNNGDAEFGGWAGTCSATYDSCTEFQDKLAQDDGEIYGETDGTSYFYLNNDTLSEYGLSDSQKCNGQVSLKNGCAMFYDTGDTSLLANASATEIASRHADELFGSEPYGLVDPIDCENGGDSTITTATGEVIDLCATRCAYDLGEIYDLTDGETYKAKLDAERVGTADYDRDDLYAFGGSCYSATDCTSIRSESGMDVKAISCATQVRVDPFSASSSFGGSFNTWNLSNVSAGFSEVPRQENDVNAPLKVNRDRSCSEWLSCSSTNTKWDDASARFITTCSDIALCTGYDATTGSSFCSDWDFEKPEVIFDTDWYASRDTSWYGNEYSGMAIPNLFPVQALTQADVSPVGYCVYTDSTTNISRFAGDGSCEELGVGCNTYGICMSPEDTIELGLVEGKDYALVLNAGSCSEEGAACSVGYCEKTGAACATSDQCSEGSCLVGSCYDIDSAALCQTSADCNEGQVCYGGACATIEESIAIEEYDPATASADTCTANGTQFVGDAIMKIGSCINEQCLLAPNGEKYEDSTAEGKTCRAYPESTSPFPNDVVEKWYSPGNAGTVDTDPEGDALPYDLLSGFENVETCTYGEDCDCSYTKATFGRGSDVKYYGMNWEPGNISVCEGDLATNTDAGSVCKANSDCSSASCVRATSLGLCQGGERAGGYCTENNQCGEGATCEKTTREDVLYGMQGFCLEKDTSINILGDRNKQACINWLPVDELAGDTDLQAKYTSAGYFEETNYCSYLRPYAEVKTSWGCLEVDSTEQTVMRECLNKNTACPVGFTMVAGPYKNAIIDGNTVPSSAHNDVCKFGGDNDCPFMCVPLESTTTTGESCDQVIQKLVNEDKAIFTDDKQPAGYYLGRYWIEDINNYEEAFNALENCTTDGVEYFEYAASATEMESSFEQNTWGWMVKDHLDVCDGAVDNCGWRDYNGAERMAPYLGCKEMVQVGTVYADDGAAPWTDQLLNPANESDTLASLGLINSTYSVFGYAKNTKNAPFGAAQQASAILAGDASPSYVNQCRENAATGSSWTFYVPTGIPGTDGASGMSCTTGSEVEDVNAAEAGAFTFFDGYEYYQNHAYQEDKPSTFTNIDANGTGQASILDKLFAKSVQFLTFTDGLFDEATGEPAENPIDGSLEESTTSAYSGATWDMRATYGNPPKVWSVDTQSCSDDGVLCEEGVEGRITLNGQDTGTQSGAGFFSANIKFYAAADKNQLPLRRVIVDWGDKETGGSFTGSSAEDNFFKNSRGLQDGTQNSKCELETEWGLTSESCDPYYFSYNHIYTCSSEILRDTSIACVGDGSTGDANGNFPCALDQSGDLIADSCVFQPRVHVRDNWGFCTGVCSASDPTRADGDKCFDEGTIAYPEGESTDECIYNYDAPSNTPFINYDGVIVVAPE